MAWNVLNVDITGNFSFSSMNDKVIVKLEKANKQKQPPEVLKKKGVLHRKTPVSESLFW